MDETNRRIIICMRSVAWSIVMGIIAILIVRNVTAFSSSTVLRAELDTNESLIFLLSVLFGVWQATRRLLCSEGESKGDSFTFMHRLPPKIAVSDLLGVIAIGLLLKDLGVFTWLHVLLVAKHVMY